MKIEFRIRGAYEMDFHEVSFYYDEYEQKYMGDVQIRDHALYVKKTLIPIKRSWVPAAYNDFIQATHPGFPIYKLTFHIDFYGNYMREIEEHSNVVSKFMGALFRERHDLCSPSLPENPNY